MNASARVTPTPHSPRHPRGGVPVGGLAILLVIVIIAVAITMNAGNGSSYVENVAEARRTGQRLDVSLDTRSIAQLVTAYQLQNDRYPATFEDMDTRAPLDPWGQPLSFSIDQSTQPATLVVRSIGQDGQAGTEDDIEQRERLSV
ncbi:MAG: type II secretion system protein GspG [Phycisphaerales bacterium]|nr:type II secretion system protein GspG [Phycisphaerales bacterium]MCB9840625.1 type II secretion system protein GspG [Phycisphaeraceae bacterium]